MKGETKAGQGYRFLDKDEVIDVVRTAVQISGISLAAIERDSGVKAATVSRWLYGETKRPQHATVDFVLRACGVRLTPIWTATGKEVGK